jgi:hypothetical protein
LLKRGSNLEIFTFHIFSHQKVFHLSIFQVTLLVGKYPIIKQPYKGQDNMAIDLFHYTTGECLIDIITDGEIKVTKENSKYMMPAVWFSMNPFWEETANKSLRCVITGKRRFGNKRDTHNHGGGLSRIQVHHSTAPLNFKQYVKASGITNKIKKGLIRSAKQVGSDYRQWRISLKPVKKIDWIKVERFDWEKQCWYDF